MQSSELKGVKRQFFGPNKLQNHRNEGKGREKKKERGRRKEEKRKKQRVALLIFIIMATLETGGKKTAGLKKGKFGRNVFKNPARHIIKIKKIFNI